MLLRLYYLYSKSPKKCQELTDIVEDLKEAYEFPKDGNFQFGLKVEDGLVTSEKHSRGLLTDSVLISIILQL